jgi:hypothetical protein
MCSASSFTYTYELIDWKRRAASKSIGSCARPIGIGEEVNERVIHRFFSLLQLNQLAIDSCFLSFLSWTDRDGTERNGTPPAWSRTQLGPRAHGRAAIRGRASVQLGRT